MIRKAKRFSVVTVAWVVALAMLLGLAGCSGAPAATENAGKNGGEEVQQEEPQILRLAGGDTGLPNPYKHVPRGPGMSKMQLLYDSLLEKDEKGDIPWLAASWGINADGTVYTFRLQENALWHDGTPLTAEDVAFTMAYYENHPPVANDLLVKGSHIVKETRVLDPYTIEVVVDRYDNNYLTKLGNVRILPKHIWDKVSDPVTYKGEDAAIGSGPYKLESYDPRQGAYRYVAFEEYWGPKPAATAIEWVPVSDGVLAFANGEIDLINASPDVLSNYQNNPEYTIKTGHSFHSYRLMMNMERVEELRDVKLRQALAYGIDRQELVDKAARGAAEISSQGYVLPVSAWYNEAVEQYDYNPEKARELLAGKTYSFKLLTDNSADGIRVAELVKLSLAKIGIETAVESVEAKTRDNAVNTGEYQLLLINSGGMGGDPDYLRAVYGKGAKTVKGWSNDEVVGLAEAQATERDEGARKEMIDELQIMIADEVPMIMLHGAVDNFVYRHALYDGWMFRYDHSKCDHNKLSYMIRK